MSIDGRRVLFIGEESPLNQVVERQLLSAGADLHVVRETDVGALPDSLSTSMPYDGFVFACMHSEFRPIKLVKPQNVLDLMNDNFGLFIEAIRLLVAKKLIRDGASVVAYSSISSIRAMKAKTVFCSAKAALDASVRCLALELSDRRIRVNSIQKGGTECDLAKTHIAAVNVINQGATVKQQPLGLTSGVEIANLTMFLLSNAAPTLTGTSIVIDGGYTL